MSKARDLANAGTALTTVSATELGYVDGVTSAIQTQLNAKEATLPSQTGNSGKYLTTDGSAKSWGTVSSGGMTLISETVASANSSINLTSIPGTYKQLMVVWSGLYPSNTSSLFSFRFNNDSTASIYEGVFAGAGSTSITGFSDNTPDDPNNGFALFGYSASSSSTLYHEQSKGVILIDNYASASKYKFYEGRASWRATGSVYRLTLVNGVYKSTSAITSFDIFRVSGAGTLTNATNTSIRLYGLS